MVVKSDLENPLCGLRFSPTVEQKSGTYMYHVLPRDGSMRDICTLNLTITNVKICTFWFATVGPLRLVWQQFSVHYSRYSFVQLYLAGDFEWVLHVAMGAKIFSLG